MGGRDRKGWERRAAGVASPSTAEEEYEVEDMVRFGSVMEEVRHGGICFVAGMGEGGGGGGGGGDRGGWGVYISTPLSYLRTPLFYY